MTEKSRPIILWFRKDLRVDDNAALSAALGTGRAVIPLYIRDAGATSAPLGSAQQWWLHHSLTALEAALKARGSRLIFQSGTSSDVITRLIAETRARGVYWNRLYNPASFDSDAALKATLRDNGLEAESFPGQLLHEPAKLKTGSGGPYKVYTPFWRALEKSGGPKEPIPAPETIPEPVCWPKSENLADWSLLPTTPNWANNFSEIWTPGCDAALERLDDFLDEDVEAYKDQRDLPAHSVTSRLSPSLALGEISPARIWHAAHGGKASSANVIKFRQELAWRDFCHHLLYHFPALATKNWNDRFDDFPWEDNADLFDKWTRGQTGYPIVDAGMRELWRHGTMHNRVRMIAASFLIKDLMIDWRRGEQWFRDTLVDADPASNPANWQWVAGSGADASPYFRIFNPTLQGERFDREGVYVRRFVPELEKLEKRYIHKPFEAPEDVLQKAGITLGKTYPFPIVGHRTARQRALDAYSDTSKD